MKEKEKPINKLSISMKYISYGQEDNRITVSTIRMSLTDDD